MPRASADALCTCGHRYRGHKWKGSARSGWRDHCETPLCLCKRGILAKGQSKPKVKVPKTAEDEKGKLYTLADAGARQVIKVPTGIKTLDQALDGGFVKDSAVLLAGMRGGGKSSLMTVVAGELAKKRRVLYVSGEENISQFAYRAKRFQLPKNLPNLYIMDKANLDTIWEYADVVKPEFIIIDSLQSVHGRDMNGMFVANKRVANHFSYQLKKLRQRHEATLILIGHETKGGDIAGDESIQHDVDVVAKIDPDEVSNAKVLTIDKNRFGNTPGIFRFVIHDKRLEEIVPLDVARVYKSPELL